MVDWLAIDWQSIVAYGFGLVLLIIIAWILVWPIKLLLRLIANALIGLFLLLVFNFVGGYFGLYIPPNPITALVVGILGVPGLVLLLVIKYVL